MRVRLSGRIGRVVLGIGLFVVAGELQAHPGHGSEEGWSLLHWLGEPEHALPIAAALILGVVIAARLLRRRSSR